MNTFTTKSLAIVILSIVLWICIAESKPVKTLHAKSPLIGLTNNLYNGSMTSWFEDHNGKETLYVCSLTFLHNNSSCNLFLIILSKISCLQTNRLRWCTGSLWERVQQYACLLWCWIILRCPNGRFESRRELPLFGYVLRNVPKLWGNYY